MSKHFELMQQMEAERLLNADPLPKRVVPGVATSDASVALLEIPTGIRMASAVAPPSIDPTPIPGSISTAVLSPAYVPAVSPSPEIVAQPEPVIEPAPIQVAQPISVPRIPQAESRRWAGAEALRLAQQIFLQKSQSAPAMVVFAGIDSGNGCSEVCASVAEALARAAGKSVCLVEANFRAPALSGLFATTNDCGLTDALVNPGPIRSFTKRIADENLWLLSSGAIGHDSPSLLNSNVLRARLQEIRKEFEYILIDAPPLNRHSDAVVLGRLADGLVMVLGADSTQREAASDAATNLRSARVSILAAVLNKGNSPASQDNSSTA